MRMGLINRRRLQIDTADSLAAPSDSPTKGRRGDTDERISPSARIFAPIRTAIVEQSLDPISQATFPLVGTLSWLRLVPLAQLARERDHRHLG